MVGILRKFRGNTIPGTPAGTLAAKALMISQSVPLRLGVTRVPRTCYGFCVRGLCGATTRLVPSGAAGCVAWSYARR